MLPTQKFFFMKHAAAELGESAYTKGNVKVYDNVTNMHTLRNSDRYKDVLFLYPDSYTHRNTIMSSCKVTSFRSLAHTNPPRAVAIFMKWSERSPTFQIDHPGVRDITQSCIHMIDHIIRSGNCKRICFNKSIFASESVMKYVLDSLDGLPTSCDEIENPLKLCNDMRVSISERFPSESMIAFGHLLPPPIHEKRKVGEETDVASDGESAEKLRNFFGQRRKFVYRPPTK